MVRKESIQNVPPIQSALHMVALEEEAHPPTGGSQRRQTQSDREKPAAERGHQPLAESPRDSIRTMRSFHEHSTSSSCCWRFHTPRQMHTFLTLSGQKLGATTFELGFSLILQSYKTSIETVPSLWTTQPSLLSRLVLISVASAAWLHHLTFIWYALRHQQSIVSLCFVFSLFRFSYFYSATHSLFHCCFLPSPFSQQKQPFIETFIEASLFGQPVRMQILVTLCSQCSKDTSIAFDVSLWRAPSRCSKVRQMIPYPIKTGNYSKQA